MSAQTLRKELQSIRPGDAKAGFALLSKLAMVASLAEHDGDVQAAREILIRVLEAEEQGNSPFANYSELIDGLVHQVGLYPYLRLDQADLRQQLAAEVHRPRELDRYVFTTKQAEVYRELLAGNSVILSAPTSFGKSLIIDAIIASEKFHNLVIVVPTLALVDETRRRLMNFKNLYRVITHPGQAVGERNIFIHTQERVLENENLDDVDFFVIDEFYKLDLDGEGEGDSRGILLNQAFYKLARKARQFYMLGPNIDSLPDGFEKRYRCKFVRTEFSTVTSEVHSVLEGGDEEARLVGLVPKLEGPSLYFSSSPKRARQYSGAVAGVTPVGFEPHAEVLEVVDWLSANFSPNWGVVTRLRAGVGVHHGKLPRSIAQLMVRLFNRNRLSHLVCTSTLIEGVNTAARNVVVVDNKIWPKTIDYFTFNNIKGRAGRMRQYFVGHVYLFHKPPKKKDEEFVDIPVFTQNDSAPDALLIQLDRSDLTRQAKARMQEVWQQDVLDLATIQANRGFDPLKQIAMAREIASDVGYWHELLAWTGYPTYEQLDASLQLFCKHMGFPSTNDVRTAKSLVYKLHQYRKNPDYRGQIANAVDGKTGEAADEALENFLEFTRQWVSFRSPRYLLALERIQHRVFTMHRKRPGSYAHFSGQLESLFMPQPVSALEEYGIPIQLAQKVHPLIGNPTSLDEALAALGKIRVTQFKSLGDFERALLKPLCRSD